jgi:N-acetylmuramoyl-L-alanine amidase
MAGQELNFARQYDQWFMGRYQRPLLDSDAGVYRYDELIVLKQTSMPAVLLESGSIINRDEELVMASDAHKNKVAAAVASAASEYCETRGAAPALVAQPQPKDVKPAASVAHRRVAQPRLAQQRSGKKR